MNKRVNPNSIEGGQIDNVAQNEVCTIITLQKQIALFDTALVMTKSQSFN